MAIWESNACEPPSDLRIFRIFQRRLWTFVTKGLTPSQHFKWEDRVINYRRFTLLTLGLLGSCAISSGANAALVTSADLFLPLFPTGTSTTVVGVQGVGTPSQSTYKGSGYSISFDVLSNQGIVQGSVPSTIHAVPVAGITPSGNPTYLTGDYGSTQTTDPLKSGNYLSTGTGSITVTFDKAQLSLGLLWGSIDTSNLVTFSNGDTITGTEIQNLALGFTKNGYQGPTGSAYVLAVDTNPFTSVTFSSGVTSFELASVVASVGNVSTVPLPASAPMFGAALLALAGFGYGINRWVAPQGKKADLAA